MLTNEQINSLVSIGFNQAWTVIFAMVFAAGPLLWAFNRITPYYYFHPDREGSPIFGFGYCFWYCCGAMFYQGAAIERRRPKGRT